MSKRKATSQRSAKKDSNAAPSPERALLVAVELGGEWPAGFEGSEATVRRVLTQQEGEVPLAFAERVGGEIEKAFSAGAALGVTAIACNERADEAAVDARRRMARTVLGCMASAHAVAARVYLTASSRTSGRLHHALSTLAAELGAEWSRAGLEISVRFGDDSRSAPRTSLEPLPKRVA